MMDAKELFDLLYDRKINHDECIEVICDGEDNHFILNYDYGNNDYAEFDNAELMSCLLFKEYKFKIIKQEEAFKRLEEKRRKDEIKQLEERLKELKSEEMEEIKDNG